MDWKSVIDRVIGVIDLKNHVAVHAMSGQRHLYRPVELSRFRTVGSTQASDGNAIGLVDHYRQCGIRRFYVADLDALSGGAVQTRCLEHLVAAGHSHEQRSGEQRSGEQRSGEQWILDVGLNESVAKHDLAWMLDLGRRFDGQVTWIVASESALSDQTVPYLAKQFDPASLILGIDLRQGKFAGPTDCGSRLNTQWSGDPNSPPGMNQKSIDRWIESGRLAGLEAALVLDVSAVGTASGPAAIDCCHYLHQRFPSWRLISGGGCRDPADVAAYLDAGCSECLVATALHR